ncbi:MAG TPA: YtxH domain-containing protein [Vicinamibacteria bacterium]|nr:YtxH domain-containing protein [Vicinamibacteria bacterium]
MADEERSTGTSGVVLSFLLGALSGAALAILFAPRSGRETREMLGERLRETADRSRRLGEKAVERSREAAADATGYLERQREALEKRRDRLSAAVEAGRQAYRDEKEKM